MTNSDTSRRTSEPNRAALLSQSEQFAALTDVLSRTIDETKRLLYRHFKIVPRTKRHKLFALIVLNDLVRKSESVLAMIRADADAGVNVVVRSAFESYADVLNLFKYPDTYTDFMLWASHGQQRTLLQSFADPTSKFADAFKRDALAYMRRSPDDLLAETVRQRDKIAAQLPELYKNSSGKIDSRDIFRFELAGKLAEYNALYRHLSGGAHGRVSAMGEGIFPDGDEPIQWPPLKALMTRPLVALDSLCAMLLECGSLLARKFDKPLAGFKGLATEQSKVREGQTRIIIT